MTGGVKVHDLALSNHDKEELKAHGQGEQGFESGEQVVDMAMFR